MKLLNCCLIVLNQGNLKCQPTHGNENANVSRYPTRDRVRPKYLDDYVTGEDIDEAIGDTANCTIDWPMFPNHTKMRSHPQRPISGGML